MPPLTVRKLVKIWSKKSKKSKKWSKYDFHNEDIGRKKGFQPHQYWNHTAIKKGLAELWANVFSQVSSVVILCGAFYSFWHVVLMFINLPVWCCAPYSKFKQVKKIGLADEQGKKKQHHNKIRVAKKKVEICKSRVLLRAPPTPRGVSSETRKIWAGQ